MFTFLLNEYRAGAVKLYRMRLIAIYLSLSILVLITGFALVIPTFATLNTKRETALIEKTAAANTKKDDASSIESDVHALKEKINTIKETSGELSMTAILDRVLAKKTSGILITSIALTRGGQPGAIALGGIAKTRDELVAFSKQLQNETSFTKVNLPVESLAKSKDVAFSILIDSKF